MRKTVVAALLAASLSLSAVPAGAVATPRSETRLEIVARAGSRAEAAQFAISQRSRDRLNRLIRAAMPLVCPVLVKGAEPAFRAYLDSTCKAIAASPDPLMVITQFLPLACAGDPPLLALVYPDLEEAIRASCPLLLKLPKLLHLE